jgi:ribonuclease D
MLNEQEQNNYNPEIGLEIIENQIVTQPQEEVIVSEVTTIIENVEPVIEIENVEPIVNEEITEVVDIIPTNVKKMGNSIKKAFSVK